MIMNMTIENGELCIGSNRFPLCKAGVGNGRPNLPAGRYEVTTQWSGEHGAILPAAHGLGWIGANPGCDVILGGVRGRNGVIPSPSCVATLLAKLEVAEGSGQKIMLEVR